jgi:hypothetical protein
MWHGAGPAAPAGPAVPGDAVVPGSCVTLTPFSPLNVYLSIKIATQPLTVNSCIKVRLDLQADKSPVVVNGPFFPRVVNPRYRIRGTNV